MCLRKSKKQSGRYKIFAIEGTVASGKTSLLMYLMSNMKGCHVIEEPKLEIARGY